MAKSAKTLRMLSGSPRKTAKSKTKAKKRLDNMDAKTLADVDKLVENIKNNIVTLLLVYADWCGHCGTFKNDIWKRLAGTKGRKLPMAQINEKVLGHLKEKIPDLKIDGYPTVSLIGKDLKAAEIKDPVSGETSNALPNTRDMASMTKLITANPSEVMANNGLSAESAEIPDENKSVTPTEKSLVARKEAGRNAVNNMNNGTPNVNVDSSPVDSPPDVEDDLIQSQGTPEEKSTPVTVGGSLYAALVAATRQIAVPAALTAVAVSRRKKARKGTKKH